MDLSFLSSFVTSTSIDCKYKKNEKLEMDFISNSERENLNECMSKRSVIYLNSDVVITSLTYFP